MDRRCCRIHQKQGRVRTVVLVADASAGIRHNMKEDATAKTLTVSV
jgi:hypothetical protein